MGKRQNWLILTTFMGMKLFCARDTHIAHRDEKVLVKGKENV